MVKLYVGNIPWAATEQSVRDFFGENITLDKVAICTDRETGKPRGFAFVEIADDQIAMKAIEDLDGADFGGRRAIVNKAVDKPRGERGPKPSGGQPRGDAPRGGVGRSRRVSYEEGDSSWESQKHK